MSSTYAGNPASYPANITRPSDGDVRDAASVAVGLDALADRTANLDADRTNHETRLDLERPEYATTAGVVASIAYLGADVNVTLLTTAKTTAVGDRIEFAYSGQARLHKHTGTAGPMTFTVTLQANENGGGWVAIPNAAMLLSYYVPSAGGIPNELTVPTSITTLFDVATAGTLAIRAVFSFSGGTNASDFVDFQSAHAALKIWRA